MDTEEIFEILQSCDIDQITRLKSVAQTLNLERIENRLNQLISILKE